MSNISRRTFVHTAAASIGTFGILTGRAKGAEFTYKFANNQPVTHPMNVRANRGDGEDPGGVRRPSRGERIPEQPARRRHRHALSSSAAGALEIFALSGINVLSTLTR